jgi:hypothetical protein
MKKAEQEKVVSGKDAEQASKVETREVVLASQARQQNVGDQEAGQREKDGYADRETNDVRNRLRGTRDSAEMANQNA